MNIPLAQKIFDKHGLGRVDSVNKEAKGITGGVFDVNNRFILKIHREPTDPFITARNAAVCQIFKEHQIKAPELIALDVSKEIIPDNYLIMTKLPGENLKEQWLDFTDDGKKKIFFDYGVMMAEIHLIKMPYFGDLTNPAQQFNNWSDCFSFRFQKNFDYLKDRRLLNEKTLEQVNDFFLKNKYLTEINFNPVLVHNDFQTKNLKYVDGQISGIFDFDECLAGHNEMEFIKTCLPFKKEKVWLDQIISGYKSIGGLSEDFPQRIKLYTLKFCLKVLTFNHAVNLLSPHLEDKFNWAIEKILHEDWRYFDYPQHLWRQEGIYY